MTKTMRGVMFLGHGQVEVREFPVPTPVGTQVLVQVKAAGICGSDMHRYHLKPEEIPPTIRGHEPSGVVAAVGEAVTFVKVGDRVSVYHAPACNHCEPCAQGYFFNCTTIGPGWRLGNKPHGGDADYVLVDQNVCFKLPDELNFEDGAIIACAGGTAYHALNRAGGVRGSQFALITGLGPVGLCAVLLANAMGATVIGSDPSAYRREQALKHGASFVIDPSQQNMVDEVKRITGEGAEFAVETSGNDQARVDLLRCTPYQATLVYVGIGGRAANLMLGPGLGERLLTGSNMFTHADYYALVRLMLRHGLHFSDLVTHRFPIESAKEAFDLMETRETGKVMLVWP
jgi:threonine dehydrogenase-like Zn-dependent dehydrogenase